MIPFFELVFFTAGKLWVLLIPDFMCVTVTKTGLAHAFGLAHFWSCRPLAKEGTPTFHHDFSDLCFPFCWFLGYLSILKIWIYYFRRFCLTVQLWHLFLVWFKVYSHQMWIQSSSVCALVSVSSYLCHLVGMSRMWGTEWKDTLKRFY